VHRNSQPAAKGLGRTTTLLLIALLLLVMVVPVVVNRDAAFVGTDDAAETAITQIAPRTQPWFTPIWTPPGHEVETLLFSLQAAAGAGMVGYLIGVRHGKAGKAHLSGSDEREAEE